MEKGTMSNLILSKKTGYILYKLGGKTLKELMDGIKGIDEINHIVLASITETPSFREGLSASVEDQEAFVKYLEMMKQYVDSIEIPEMQPFCQEVEQKEPEKFIITEDI